MSLNDNLQMILMLAWLFSIQRGTTSLKGKANHILVTFYNNTNHVEPEMITMVCCFLFTAEDVFLCLPQLVVVKSTGGCSALQYSLVCCS